MKCKSLTLLLCSIPLLSFATPVWSDHPLKPEQFTKLHKLIQPKPEEEKWLQIPWQGNLWKARQQAAKEGKPLLLWEMDGNPLGCT